jgi:hypothetical protein
LAQSAACPTFLGWPKLSNGQLFAEPGLWGIAFGNGVKWGGLNSLYFNAGIQDQQAGLFGQLAPTPEPSSAVLGGLGGAMLLLASRRRRSHTSRGVSSSIRGHHPEGPEPVGA